MSARRRTAGLVVGLGLAAFGSGCPADRADSPEPASPPSPAPAPPPAPPAALPPPVELAPPSRAAARLAGRYRGERLAFTVEPAGGDALAGVLELNGIAYTWSGTVTGAGLTGSFTAEGRELPFEAVDDRRGGLELVADRRRYPLRREEEAPPPRLVSGVFRGALGERPANLQLAAQGDLVRGTLDVGAHRYTLRGEDHEGTVRGRLRDVSTGEEAGFRLDPRAGRVTLVVDLPGEDGRRSWETLYLDRVER